MDVIHTDAPQLETSSGGWFSTAPTQGGIHPIPTPGTDAVSAAVATAVADWPAVHEALVASRTTGASDMAAANGSTIATITTTDATNSTQISGIEV